MTGAELSEHVMVRMTPELLAAVRADSEAKERTVSQTIRHALRLFMEARNADF